MSGTVILDVQDLSFAYGGRKVLDSVGFAVRRGETVILLGPNGAGKTTLFSLITGLFTAAAGRIEIAGKDVARDPVAALAPLGIVFQAQTLDLDLTVRQNLAYFCALRGLPRREHDALIRGALGPFGLADRLGERVRALNGGHRRRVEIARALLHSPDLLLLDEPTVGLDIPTRRDLVEALHAQGRAGRAVLWATHLIDEVAETDRVLVLHQGRIMADGSPADLCAQTGAADLDGAYAVLTDAVTA